MPFDDALVTRVFEVLSQLKFDFNAVVNDARSYPLPIDATSFFDVAVVKAPKLLPFLFARCWRRVPVGWYRLLSLYTYFQSSDFSGIACLLAHAETAQDAFDCNKRGVFHVLATFEFDFTETLLRGLRTLVKPETLALHLNALSGGSKRTPLDKALLDDHLSIADLMMNMGAAATVGTTLKCLLTESVFSDRVTWQGPSYGALVHIAYRLCVASCLSIPELARCTHEMLLFSDCRRFGVKGSPKLRRRCAVFQGGWLAVVDHFSSTEALLAALMKEMTDTPRSPTVESLRHRVVTSPFQPLPEFQAFLVEHGIAPPANRKSPSSEHLS